MRFKGKPDFVYVMFITFVRWCVLATRHLPFAAFRPWPFSTGAPLDVPNIINTAEGESLEETPPGGQNIVPGVVSLT